MQNEQVLLSSLCVFCIYATAYSSHYDQCIYVMGCHSIAAILISFSHRDRLEQFTWVPRSTQPKLGAREIKASYLVGVCEHSDSSITYMKDITWPVQSL